MNFVRIEGVAEERSGAGRGCGGTGLGRVGEGRGLLLNFSKPASAVSWFLHMTWCGVRKGSSDFRWVSHILSGEFARAEVRGCDGKFRAKLVIVVQGIAAELRRVCDAE